MDATTPEEFLSLNQNQELSDAYQALTAQWQAEVNEWQAKKRQSLLDATNARVFREKAAHWRAKQASIIACQTDDDVIAQNRRELIDFFERAGRTDQFVAGLRFAVHATMFQVMSRAKSFASLTKSTYLPSGGEYDVRCPEVFYRSLWEIYLSRVLSVVKGMAWDVSQEVKDLFDLSGLQQSSLCFSAVSDELVFFGAESVEDTLYPRHDYEVTQDQTTTYLNQALRLLTACYQATIDVGSHADQFTSIFFLHKDAIRRALDFVHSTITSVQESQLFSSLQRDNLKKLKGMNDRTLGQDKKLGVSDRGVMFELLTCGSHEHLFPTSTFSSLLKREKQQPEYLCALSMQSRCSQHLPSNPYEFVRQVRVLQGPEAMVKNLQAEVEVAIEQQDPGLSVLFEENSDGSGVLQQQTIDWYETKAKAEEAKAEPLEAACGQFKQQQKERFDQLTRVIEATLGLYNHRRSERKKTGKTRWCYTQRGIDDAEKLKTDVDSCSGDYLKAAQIVMTFIKNKKTMRPHSFLTLLMGTLYSMNFFARLDSESARQNKGQFAKIARSVYGTQDSTKLGFWDHWGGKACSPVERQQAKIHVSGLFFAEVNAAKTIEEEARREAEPPPPLVPPV